MAKYKVTDVTTHINKELGTYTTEINELPDSGTNGAYVFIKEANSVSNSCTILCHTYKYEYKK